MHKKSTFISSFLTLTFIFSLLIPSLKTYGQNSEEHFGIITQLSVVEKDDLINNIYKGQNLDENSSILFSDSKILSESISIETDRYLAEVDESINFSMSVDTGGETVAYAYLVLRSTVNGRIYKEFVNMTLKDEDILEGEFYVSSGINSGVYSIDNIEFLKEEGKNFYRVFDTIYNSAFYDDTEYRTMSLPINIVEIAGTRGEIIPELEIKSPKRQYTKNEEIIITVDAVAEEVEYVYATITLENTSIDFKPSISVELEKNELGVLSGSFKVNEYTAPGEYTIENIFLYDYYYDSNVDIYNSKYEDEDRANNYSDFENFSIEITGTIIDNIQPKFISCNVAKTELIYGESLEIEVEVVDLESGISDVYVYLENDTNYKFTWLKYVGENKYKGYIKFDLDESIGEKYDLNIYAQDHQYNTEHYSNESLTVRFSGNQNIRTLSGSNRFNTAIEIGRHIYNGNIAIVASGESFPDALAAGPLAKIFDAPIYLAQKNRISQSTIDELTDNNIDYVIMLGGESAISKSVEQSIIAAGIYVDRIAGQNRFETAISIARDIADINGLLYNESSRVVLANAMNYPDALSIGSYASIIEAPILLTKGDQLNKGVKEYLEQYDVKNVDIVGGISVISESLVNELKLMGIHVTRYAGEDRFSTSVVVAEQLFKDSDKIVIANGMNFADALAAVPLAAQENMPILLVRSDRLPKTVQTYISTKKDSLERIVPVGGEAAVSKQVKDILGSLLK